MTWVEDVANEQTALEDALRTKAQIIGGSNFWARLVRQVETDVKAINENPRWARFLRSNPLQLIPSGDGYTVVKKTLPAHYITINFDGESVNIRREETTHSDEERSTRSESLKVDVHGTMVVLRGRKDIVLVVPEEASEYILRPIVETLIQKGSNV